MVWGRLGEQGQCRECTRFKSQHQNVRKNAAHKESSREKSHIHRARFNVTLESPWWAGNMAQHRLWARRGLYRRGRLRNLVHAWYSMVGSGLS
jgi:hypothetical protein